MSVVPEYWPDGYGFILTKEPVSDIPLIRIHSRCAYGDIFGSDHCDCKNQLVESAAQIRETGGFLFYLEQEGRGAGLLAKARAYRGYQLDGVDTFTHYREVQNIEEDVRGYEPVADFLVRSSITTVKVMTNNPEKIACLQEAGIQTKRVSLKVDHHPLASHYMGAKRSRGHKL